MNLSKKKVVSLALATAMIASGATSAFAATNAYVGNVGFDVDRMGNEATYKAGFDKFLLNNLEKSVILSLDLGTGTNPTVDVNKFGNSGSQDIVDYATKNPSQVPGGSVVWDGKGDPGQVNQDLTIKEVKAVTENKLQVTLSKAVDAAEKANFSVDGMTVISAELDATKTVVTLNVSNAELGKEYSLVAKGLKVNAEVQKDITLKFTMPKAESLYIAKLKVDGDKKEIKADNKTSILVTFELTDLDNKPVNADNIEVAFSTTFGTFAEKRVTVQNGKAEVLFNSEVLTSSKTALLSAVVMDASNKNLIGLKSEANLVLNPNPDGGEEDTVGATLTDTNAEMADRITLYFNKDVDLTKYVLADTKTGYDVEKSKLEITVTDEKKGKRTVKAIQAVPGNKKALVAIFDKTKTLTDNSKYTVQVRDKTGKITTDKILTSVLTDARRPAILGVAKEGLNKLVVTFSEPVNDTAKALENWVIDGYRLDNAKWGVTGKEVTVDDVNTTDGTDTRHVVRIKLGKDADGKQIYFAPGTHAIQGANIGDFANLTDNPNNIINTQTLDFVIAEDNEVPTATVEVQSPEQYVVSFNKKIEGTVDHNVVKLQKFDKTTNTWKEETKQKINVRKVPDTDKYIVETTKDWTDDSVYNTKVYNLNYYNDSYRLFIDENKVTNAANGKANAKIELLLEGAMKSADVVSPVIDKIEEVTAGISYEATMSEPVKFPQVAKNLVPPQNKDVFETPSQGQYVDKIGYVIPTPTAEFIKKDQSKTIKGTVAASTDPYNKVVNVTPDTKLEAGEWTLVIRSISDDIGNTAASATKDFTVKGDDVVVNTEFKVAWAAADSDGDFTNGLTTVGDSDGDKKGDGDGKNDAVYVKFTQPVKITGSNSSALTTTNYTLNGDPLPKGTQVVADINGYDSFDSVIDSVTIILPDKTLTNEIDATVITVSPYIQNTDGKALANGGQFKLTHNYGVEKDVDDVSKLKAALKNPLVREITLKADVELGLGEDVTVNRPVKINRNGKNITGGSITIDTTEAGTIDVKGAGTIDKIVVKAPNAEFKNADGTIANLDVQSLYSKSLINTKTITTLTVQQGAEFSLKNEGTITKLTNNGTVVVETLGTVTTIDDKGTGSFKEGGSINPEDKKLIVAINAVVAYEKAAKEDLSDNVKFDAAKKAKTTADAAVALTDGALKAALADRNTACDNLIKAEENKRVTAEAAKIDDKLTFQVPAADKTDATKVTNAAVVEAQKKVAQGYTVTKKADGTLDADKLTVTFTVTKTGTEIKKDTESLVLTFTNN